MTEIDFPLLVILSEAKNPLISSDRDASLSMTLSGHASRDESLGGLSKALNLLGEVNRQRMVGDQDLALKIPAVWA